MVLYPSRSHEGCSYSDHQHTSQMYTMHYNPISTVELKRFIRDRTGNDAPHGLRRFQYISMLEGLDRHWTFRFMDLPPEMRNLVYEVLVLRDPEQRRKAHLEILRVSKLVHKEAVDVFRTINIAPLDIRVLRSRQHAYNGNHHTLEWIEVARSGDPSVVEDIHITEGHDTNGILSASMSGRSRMRNIRLCFHTNNNGYGRQGVANWTLPRKVMSEFVKTASDLRELTLVLELDEIDSLEDFRRELLPLGKLSKEVTIKMEKSPEWNGPQPDMLVELLRYLEKIRASN